MPLSQDTLAVIIRLEGAAAEVQASARAVSGRDHTQLTHVGDQLRGLIDQVRGAISNHEDLSGEFERLFAEERERIFWRDVDPRASALVGWLRGVVAAESFQARLEAEARAYAEERVKAERKVGFAPAEDAKQST